MVSKCAITVGDHIIQNRSGQCSKLGNCSHAAAPEHVRFARKKRNFLQCLGFAPKVLIS